MRLSSYFPYIFAFFLVISLPLVVPKSSSRSSSRVSSSSSKSSCSSCCHPAESVRILPIAFFLPATIIPLIVLVIWLVGYRDKYRQWKINSFEHLHTFSKNIPFMQKINYHGHYFSDLNSRWTYLDKLSITFDDSKFILHGESSNCIGYNSEGTYSENKKVNFHGNGTAFTNMNLYLIDIPGTQTPALIGFWKKQKFDGVCALFPEEYQYDINKIFPFMYSKFLYAFIGLILLLSILCCITYEIGQMKGYYSYYFADYVMGYPWGAFISFFGLFLVLICLNPSNFNLFRPNCFAFVILVMIIFAISGVCLGFSAIDLVSADFLKSESLIDTHGNYTLDHDEIADLCRFSQYDCSVYWSEYYTRRTSSCADSYDYLCISFNAKDGSCALGNSEIYDLLVCEGLLQYFLWMFWCLLFFLVIDLYCIDRWPGVQKKLQEWQHMLGNEKEHIELNQINNNLTEELK